MRLPVAGRRIDGTFYDGIYEKCQPIQPSEAQPGDLVFFTGTFDAGSSSILLLKILYHTILKKQFFYKSKTQNIVFQIEDKVLRTQVSKDFSFTL